jgi:pimeloyl-ACP methyl ester carboxylesterase
MIITMKIIVSGQLIEYADEGTGKVILMLHGWGANIGTFDQLAGHLSKQFRVIRIDFPGFGKSPKPASDWSVSDYALAVGDMLKKLKISDLYAVIAHSFGGRVVIKGISQKYFNPQKVVLIGAAGVKPPKSVRKDLYKIIAKVGKTVTSLPLLKKIQPKLRKQLYSLAGSADYLQANQMKDIFLNTINEDLLPEVENIKQPALLIWGKNDSETPVSDANLMLDGLKNGRLIVIENAGHFVYMEEPEKVIKEIDGFLL